jgi:pyruvate formate lyase activating enzyme
MTGTIFHIQRYSVNDGPGIRTTVFLKGCPLRCRWCHNPESISPRKELLLREDRCIRCGACAAECERGAIHREDGDRFVTRRGTCIQCGSCVEVCVAEARVIAGREVSTEEILREVEKDRIFYDQSAGGVTFSGGEPLLQHEFLCSLLEACQGRSIHTVVDTTGYASPAIIEDVARATDLFLYDLKTMDDTKHIEFTGVSNRLIVENLQRLVQMRKEVVVRVPIVPEFNDNEQSVQQLGWFVASLENIREIHVLPYHTTGIEKYQRIGMEYSMLNVRPPSKEKIQHIVDELSRFIPFVLVGG